MIIHRSLKIMLSAVTIAGLLLGTAQAKMFKSEGEDPRTKKFYSGIAILSDDKRAQLHFQCTDSNSVPRIIFNNLEPMMPLSLPFKLFYQIDGGEPQWHYFLVENDVKRGTFYVRHTEIYGERFGLAPDFIDQNTGQVSMDFRNWVDNIHHAVVRDFADGNNALVQVVDEQDIPHDFSFNLTGFKQAMERFLPCMLD